jgi:hypothetical protein
MSAALAICQSVAFKATAAAGVETQLYPPFLDGESVHFHYRLVDRSDAVQLGIFDVRGRLVRMLTVGSQLPGDHHLYWERNAEGGTRVAPGVYFARLSVGTQPHVRKFVLTSQ